MHLSYNDCVLDDWNTLRNKVLKAGFESITQPSTFSCGYRFQYASTFLNKLTEKLKKDVKDARNPIQLECALQKNLHDFANNKLLMHYIARFLFLFKF
jgi:hypothetical protein